MELFLEHPKNECLSQTSPFKARWHIVFLITDTNISKNYSKLIHKDSFIIEAGEKNKNLETYLLILKKIPPNTDTIVAFGGGVVGDIAGFISSTFKRGIRLINIPTSLLAMVDSSIGGKNGVNLGEYKNFIGTFYNPSEVLIDCLFLKSLPEKEIKVGIAEIIKYSYLFGMPSYKEVISIMNSDINIEKVIYKSCKAKIEVVIKDPDDENYRHILNFGHTIGHAIELLYDLSHGEAISIGMAKESELGVNQGLISEEKYQELIGVLRNLGLPRDFPPNFNAEKVFDIMKADKKGEFIFALSKDNYAIKINNEKIISFLKKHNPI